MGSGDWGLGKQGWLGLRFHVYECSRGRGVTGAGARGLCSEIQCIMANAYMEPPLWTD